MMSQQPCFCGGGDSYSLCVAHSPEQLMRSRYSAYHEQEVDYLIMTTHPSKRHLQDRYELAESVKQTEWLGLKIIKKQTGCGGRNGRPRRVRCLLPQNERGAIA